MPEQQQGPFSTAIRTMVEEIVLAGAGILLLIIGVFSTVPLTNISAVGIGVFIFYTAYTSFREKFPRNDEEPSDVPADSAGQESETDPYFEPAEHRRVIQRREEDRLEPVVVERTNVTITAPAVAAEKQAAIMSVAEPQSEFNNLLVKALHIVKEVCFAHTVAFFWVKAETRQLVVEAKLSESTSFTPERKIPMGNDIISRIGTTGEPQVINDILPETERDLLCYYRNLQDIRSFIGVPVFFAGERSSQPIAVLAVDSKAADAYGEETAAMLQHSAALISSLLISYTEKYDLFADVKLIEAAGMIRKKTMHHPPVSAAVNALTDELENIIPWDSISVVLFDERQQAWSIASARVRGSDPFVSPKQPIDFESGIVGKAIRSNTLQTVNLPSNSSVLFHANERSSEVLREGMMIIVPISSGGKCFGAATVSVRKSGALSKKDIAAVQFLAATAAPELEIAELNAIVNEHIAVDEQTGTMSRNYFTARLGEELFRATDRDEDLSLVFVSLSNLSEIEQRYDGEGKDAALVHVARHLRASVRPYDTVARYDGSTFAVVLADTIANDAFLWAEKLRTAIAGSIVTAGRKSFSIAVTIGISGASSKMTGDELSKNALHVLEQAKKAGGNIVRVF